MIHILSPMAWRIRGLTRRNGAYYSLNLIGMHFALHLLLIIKKRNEYSLKIRLSYDFFIKRYISIIYIFIYFI